MADPITVLAPWQFYRYRPAVSIEFLFLNLAMAVSSDGDTLAYPPEFLPFSKDFVLTVRALILPPSGSIWHKRRHCTED